MATTTAAGSDIRVRFCPSPTGTPHVGMVRTCLFNYAYARHVGGTFVFRIEDTDAARDSEESFNAIIDSLQWMGLDWDEGVGVGGPHGPYRQSERTGIYADVAAKLLAGGYAYESFSTPEEVEKRHRDAGRDPKLGYDGYDRTLTQEQKDAYRAEGRQPVLRMRMPDEDITFTDLVRGEITFKAGSVPDYVIVRAGGDPLYTLTNPVDDAMMEITHVLRGEDLLSSTPRQIVMYLALEELGIAKFTPRFGHLPYVMGEGNRKLSKRDPESNLLLHRERGIIPEGLLNYLGLLGWSIAPDHDIFSKDEMVAAFDISDVNPNPARFDDKKCVAINAEHIRQLDLADYTARLVPYLQQAGVVATSAYDELTDEQRARLDAAAPLAQTRMQLLGEVGELLRFLFVNAVDLTYNEKAIGKLKDSAPDALRAAADVLRGLEDFTPEAIKPALDAELVDRLGIKPRLAYGPLFVAMTGTNVSIPVVDSIAILGKAEALTRIEQLLTRIVR
ncbi:MULTISPECIES: glutamate--tRNA ligase [unclassified Actinobaculum]|uniref:glutamate--tRNA ligase n=1 Tax=unclassified Actinobaculum TaxID=2609299 RepID=UPI000D529ABC|nr:MULTISPECIES: glutamate--tRNA ligase [unclassified Actinobaculum]AWE42192.1 glutamate--tRNA ligase [Actinobaculum sp. 313]RTE50755.1 glutamate--tRNA ligase [Actinobaculum sp. 352]